MESPTKNDNVIHIDYGQIQRLCMSIAIKIAGYTNFRPRMIIPVHRGGVIPAAILWTILSRDKKLPLAGWETMSIFAASYTDQKQQSKLALDIPSYVKAQINKGGDFLVMDDIYDTGQTFKAIQHQMKGLRGQVKYAALLSKSATGLNFFGDYIGEDRASKWFEFPWEM